MKGKSIERKWKMDVNAILEGISTIGFPIFITMYILTRLEAKIGQLEESINSLKEAIKEISLSLK